MNVKEAVFADDFSVVGSLNSIKDYWDQLAIGPKYGYLPKPAKPYRIVKEKKMIEAPNLFANSSVNITAEEKRHLGAVIGSKNIVTNKWKILKKIPTTNLPLCELLQKHNRKHFN